VGADADVTGGVTRAGPDPSPSSAGEGGTTFLIGGTTAGFLFGSPSSFAVNGFLSGRPDKDVRFSGFFGSRSVADGTGFTPGEDECRGFGGLTLGGASEGVLSSPNKSSFRLSPLGDTFGEGVGVAFGLGLVEVDGVVTADVGVDGVEVVFVVGVDGVDEVEVEPRAIRVSFVKNTPRLASHTKYVTPSTVPLCFPTKMMERKSDRL